MFVHYYLLHADQWLGYFQQTII